MVSSGSTGSDCRAVFTGIAHHVAALAAKEEIQMVVPSLIHFVNQAVLLMVVVTNPPCTSADGYFSRYKWFCMVRLNLALGSSVCCSLPKFLTTSMKPMRL